MQGRNRVWVRPLWGIGSSISPALIRLWHPTLKAVPGSAGHHVGSCRLYSLQSALLGLLPEMYYEFSRSLGSTRPRETQAPRSRCTGGYSLNTARASTAYGNDSLKADLVYAPCRFGSISPPASAQRPAPLLASPAASGRSRSGGPRSSQAGACSSSHVPHAEKLADSSRPLRCLPASAAPAKGRFKPYHI